MNEADIESLAAADVIFCRNVFIYFSEIAITKTLRSFSRFMCSPGYLFVGISESLLRLTRDFALEEVDDAFVYLKESHGN
jgi:chemotaxis protein methyltransferase CheR